MLAEAGGGAVRFDGDDYAPAQASDAGIIGAPSRQALAEVRAAFEALDLPLLQSAED